jgi:hypothetical protein
MPILMFELHGPSAGQFYTYGDQPGQLIWPLAYRESLVMTRNLLIRLLRCRTVVVNDLPAVRELTKDECEETVRSLPA